MSGRSARSSKQSSRRRFLSAVLSTAGAAALAGCSVQVGDTEFGLGSDGTPESTEPDAGTDPDDATDPDDETETDSPPDVERGGRLVVGLPAEPQSPNPLVATSKSSRAPLDLVYAGGVRHDPVTYEPRPHAWSDWTVETGSSPDVYWSVREGLQWNDGSDLTLEDVLFTYDYLLDNQPDRFAQQLAPVETVEESSRSEWDLHMALSEPVVGWEMDLLGLPLLPEDQWRGRDPASFDPTGTAAGAVGLGPGRLTTYGPEELVVEFDHDHYPATLGSLDWIEGHDDLLAGGPFLDAVEFRVFGSEAAMTSAFLDGDVDTMLGSLTGSDLEQVRGADGQGVLEAIDDGFSYLGYNLRRTPLDDVPFRQALSFCFDESFMVDFLLEGRAEAGDVPHPPGYRSNRPETVFEGDGEAALDAFAFRGAEGSLDVDAVRGFLESGDVVDGTEGTYAGSAYPGSLSGARTTIAEPLHDYAFGEVKSEVLADSGADSEIYVNGQTIPEILGRPMTVLTPPPDEFQLLDRALEDWVSNLRTLGVPVEREVQTYNSIIGRVFVREDFDVYPLDMTDLGPVGESLQEFFHSRNADDHRDGNAEEVLLNAMGYGVFDYARGDDRLDQFAATMDPAERREAAATAMEKVYLDCPVYVTKTDRPAVPVNTADWTGFVEDVVDPLGRAWATQAENVHRSG